jgi:O-acetyl-ADP-ribose deacetylase (regulator of RNase III)
MIFKEIQGDLFTADKKAILVHCISQDCKMGAGIAKKFAEIGVKEQLLRYHVKDRPLENKGYVFLTNSNKYPWMVANLITKEKYYDKPTYDTLHQALHHLKVWYLNEKRVYDLATSDGTPFEALPTTIAMPRIGCGLDKLEWVMVRQIIQDIFEDTDLTIEVYYL